MNQFVVFLMLIFSSFSITACSCFYQALSVQKILDTELVLEGKVMEKTKESGMNTKYNPEGHYRTEYFKYEIKIKDLIKGSYTEKSIFVYSKTHSAACGVNYDIGEYLYLFIYKHKGAYHTDLCSNNLPKNEASRKQKKIFCDFKKAKKMRKWNDEKGSLLAKGKVNQKQAEGPWVFYHKDGNVESEGTYISGEKTGEWKYYFDKSYSSEYFNESGKDSKRENIDVNQIHWKTERYENGIRIKSVNHLEKG